MACISYLPVYLDKDRNFHLFFLKILEYYELKKEEIKWRKKKG